MAITKGILQRYAGVTQFDWAAKLIAPSAHEAYTSGDHFDQLQQVQNLLKSRHIAAHIIQAAKNAALEDAARIADEHAKAVCSTPDGDQTSAMRLGAESIASAIRALKEQP